MGDFAFESKLNLFKENKIHNARKTFNVINDSSEFLINCMYYPNICLIAFLNEEFDPEVQRENMDNKKHKKVLENFAEDIANNPQIKFLLVNATCHSDLSVSFDISPQNLPNMIVYSGQSQNFYTMNEEFTKENMEKFLKNSMEGRTQYRKIDSTEIKMSYKQCEKKMNKYREEEYKKGLKIKKGLEDEDVDEEDNTPKSDL